MVGRETSSACKLNEWKPACNAFDVKCELWICMQDLEKGVFIKQGGSTASVSIAI